MLIFPTTATSEKPQKNHALLEVSIVASHDFLCCQMYSSEAIIAVPKVSYFAGAATTFFNGPREGKGPSPREREWRKFYIRYLSCQAAYCYSKSQVLKYRVTIVLLKKHCLITVLLRDTVSAAYLIDGSTMLGVSSPGFSPRVLYIGLR